jgi:hypothetical protein
VSEPSLNVLSPHVLVLPLTDMRLSKREYSSLASVPSRTDQLLRPAPEPREPLQANPTDPILSRRANPGLILPIHEGLGSRFRLRM